MHYIKIMRFIILILTIILLSSCSSKYKGLHSDLNKFTKDIYYCLKKSCKVNEKNAFFNMSIISPLLAYGGGGMSSLKENKISYKTFNLCLKKKGYTKDEDGIFELPYLTCDRV